MRRVLFLPSFDVAEILMLATSVLLIAAIVYVSTGQARLVYRTAAVRRRVRGRLPHEGAWSGSKLSQTTAPGARSLTDATLNSS